MSDKVEEAKNNEDANKQEQAQTTPNQENQQENPEQKQNTPQPQTQEAQPQTQEAQPQEGEKIQNDQNNQDNQNEGGDNNKVENGENNENEGQGPQGEEGEEAKVEGEEKKEEEKKQPENKPTDIDEKEVNKLEKKMKNDRIKNIQDQISNETIQIEQKKIDLRIMKERLTQKEKLYNELQGKPVNKTSEEKEKERRDHRKAVKSHKFTDPIERKKGRDKQIADEREKNAKQDAKKKAEFEKLTTDINELIISNKDLKNEIIDLRKRKIEALKKKEKIVEENEKKKEELKKMQENNETSKNQIMHKEYKEAVDEGNTQQKEFEGNREVLEEEYHKIREEYIKRERENKKENAKKRNMAALALSKKGMPTSSRDKDMEEELRKLADEEIMDRTPILDVCIEKWRAINNIKKTSIKIFHDNSCKIREALNGLTSYIGLDSFEELPLVYKKTEQQMSNINIYKEKLETQNDKLEYERELLINQIALLSGKEKDINHDKSEFIKQKKKNIQVIEECKENFEKEIDIRMEFIKKIQPETDKYLIKFGDTYLSDFVYGKINIEENSEYNEKTVDKYLANVQDYFKLVQSWDKSEKKDSETEIDKLRDEMKQKLGKFEQSRLLGDELYNSMKADYKKGIKLDEIIRKSSQKIALDIQNPYSKSMVMNKGKSKKKKANVSVATTEPGNYRYGNESKLTNKQQSSIVYPSKSTAASKQKVAVPA